MLRKLLLLLCLSGSVPVFAQQAGPHKIDYKIIGAVLPEFVLTTPEGKRIVNSDLKSKGNLFIMTFNPMCGHCEDETDSLEANMGLFKESRLIMLVHPNNVPMMNGFIKGHHVNDYPKIIIGADSTILSDKLFLYQGLPQINIYDKHRKLIKTFSGDVPLDSMKAYIQ